MCRGYNAWLSMKRQNFFLFDHWSKILSCKLHENMRSKLLFYGHEDFFHAFSFFHNRDDIKTLVSHVMWLLTAIYFSYNTLALLARKENLFIPYCMYIHSFRLVNGEFMYQYNMKSSLYIVRLSGCESTVPFLKCALIFHFQK